MSDHQTYSHVKCEVCGVSWQDHQPTCCRHEFRPPAVPKWVELAAEKLRADTASNLPMTDSDATKARRELAGGPTREFAGRVNGRAGQSSLEGGIRG